MRQIQIKDEQFGLLLPFVQDDKVTDINWNGSELWIDDITKGRYISDVKLPEDFINQFSAHISNVVSVNFNKNNPLMEAESNGLRISIIHEEYAHTGRSISIRKSPAIRRLDDEQMLEKKYCTNEMLNFLKNCMHAHLNIVISGTTGSGKTELLKYLTQFIIPSERTITIEDNLEIHFREINPGKDCVELKVDEDFTYTQAIKACLRQLPTWILLSEARSVEVKYLIESLTTGHKCLTTVHTDDVRKIPDRITNMVGDSNAANRIENDVYTFLDLAILIRRKELIGGGIYRYIDQIGCIARNANGEKEVVMLVENGEVVNHQLPESLEEKFVKAGIEDPFVYEKKEKEE